MDTTFLVAELGLTAEEADNAVKLLGPERVAKLADGYQNKQAYDKYRAQLADTEARLNAEITEWGQVQNQTQAEREAQARQIEDLRVEKVQLESRLTDMAIKSGIDPKTLLPEKAPVVVPDKPAFDTSKFVPREDLQALTGLMIDNPVQLMAIQADHRKLFGTDLNGDEIVALNRAYLEGMSKKQNISLRSAWEGQFKVPEKREAVRVEKYNADIAAAEARGMERARTEQAIPTAHPVGTHSPVFTRPDASAGSKLERPQPGRSTLNIAQALRDHKYRPASAAAGR